MAEDALPEKIVNSVDTLLINECRIKGIDTIGTDSSSYIRSTVTRFFDDPKGDKIDTEEVIE